MVHITNMAAIYTCLQKMHALSFACTPWYRQNAPVHAKLPYTHIYHRIISTQHPMQGMPIHCYLSNPPFHFPFECADIHARHISTYTHPLPTQSHQIYPHSDSEPQRLFAYGVPHKQREAHHPNDQHALMSIYCIIDQNTPIREPHSLFRLNVPT